MPRSFVNGVEAGAARGLHQKQVDDLLTAALTLFDIVYI